MESRVSVARHNTRRAATENRRLRSPVFDRQSSPSLTGGYPSGENRRCLAKNRLPGVAAVPAKVQRPLPLDSRIEPVTPRAIAHAAEERLCVARMVQKHPRHPGIFLFQTSRRDAPILAGIVAE